MSATLLQAIFTRALCISLFAIWLAPVMALPATIRIASRMDPNAITITEVDIVFIYDTELAVSFPATKKDWYAGKFMLTRNAGAKFDIVNTFVPQGFDSVAPPLPERMNEALKIVVFAQHDASETPAFDITNFSAALIEIDSLGIRVTDTE